MNKLIIPREKIRAWRFGSQIRFSNSCSPDSDFIKASKIKDDTSTRYHSQKFPNVPFFPPKIHLIFAFATGRLEINIEDK